MSNENAESLAKAFRVAEDLVELQMRREVEELQIKWQTKENKGIGQQMAIETRGREYAILIWSSLGYEVNKNYGWLTLPELHTKLKELTDET